MSSKSKNVYIDNLDAIVKKYNNAYHRNVKMERVDVKPSMYIDFNKENNNEGLNHVRISKFKNIFAKDFVRNWSEEVFVIKKVKNVPWAYVNSDLNG